MAIRLNNGCIRISETARDEDGIRILFAGDFCPRNRTEKYILNGGSGKIISSVAPVLSGKDLSIVNVETALTRGGIPIQKGGPHIRVDPECAGFLNYARFDVACLANNHVGDFGPEAVMETVNTLKTHGLHTVGAGENLEAAGRPLYIEINGKRIGIYASTKNMGGAAGEDKAGVNPLRPKNDIDVIRDISSKADITIVVIHNGSEMYPLPSPRTVNVCRSFADAGASAVVAIHAHCPQGIEIYKGCPIIYNLGNFLFDRRKGNLPDKRYALDTLWWKGYLVKLLFSENKAAALEVIPYTFAPDTRRIKLLADNGKDRFMHYLEHISGIIDDRDELKKLWHTWCAIRKKEKGADSSDFDESCADRIRKLQKGIAK